MKKMYYILIVVGLVLVVAGVAGLAKKPGMGACDEAAALQDGKTDVPSELASTYNAGDCEEMKDETEKLAKEDDNDPHEMGVRFERYAIQKFDERQYKTLEWAGDKKSNNHFAERNLYPDFLIEDKQTHTLFLMECKYRSRWSKNQKGEEEIQWTSQKKIDDYRYYGEQKKCDVIVLFGVGGEPDSPDEVFSVPLNKLLKPYAQRREFLKWFKVDTQKPFLYLPEKHNLAVKKG